MKKRTHFTRYVVLHTYDIRQGWKRFKAEAAELWQYWRFRAKYSVDRSGGREEKGDFEPLTDEQYAVLSKAAPAQRGKTVSSLLDPKRKRRRTRELQKPLADVTKDDVMPERGKPALFSYTDDPGHLLRQIADYVRRRAEVPDLSMVLHGSTLTHAEVDGVLGDADSVEAAARLIAAKLDRLS